MTRIHGVPSTCCHPLVELPTKPASAAIRLTIARRTRLRGMVPGIHARTKKGGHIELEPFGCR